MVEDELIGRHMHTLVEKEGSGYAAALLSYRGTSLIRNCLHHRTTVGPEA